MNKRCNIGHLKIGWRISQVVLNQNPVKEYLVLIHCPVRPQSRVILSRVQSKNWWHQSRSDCPLFSAHLRKKISLGNQLRNHQHQSETNQGMTAPYSTLSQTTMLQSRYSLTTIQDQTKKDLFRVNRDVNPSAVKIEFRP